jgi:hypothetical protein
MGGEEEEEVDSISDSISAFCRVTFHASPHLVQVNCSLSADKMGIV